MSSTLEQIDWNAELVRGDLGKARIPNLRWSRPCGLGRAPFALTSPIKEMAESMTKHMLESSPITTSDGRLVGLLLQSDAVRVAGEET